MIENVPNGNLFNKPAQKKGKLNKPCYYRMPIPIGLLNIFDWRTLQVPFVL